VALWRCLSLEALTDGQSETSGESAINDLLGPVMNKVAKKIATIR
jgi:hypothetical protein